MAYKRGIRIEFYTDDGRAFLEDVWPFRFVVNLGAEITFDEIIVENFHEDGTKTEYGVRDAEVHITLDSLNSLAIGEAVPNGTTVFTGELTQHTETNTIEPQKLV